MAALPTHSVTKATAMTGLGSLYMQTCDSMTGHTVSTLRRS